LASAQMGPVMGQSPYRQQSVTVPNDAVTRQIHGRRRRRPQY
jgi:hypothetical protein